MEYPIDVPLKRPIDGPDGEISKLVFDEPTLNTLIAVEEAPTLAKQTLVLLAGMASLSEEVFGRVRETDFAVINKRVLEPYEKAKAQEMAGNGVGEA